MKHDYASKLLFLLLAFRARWADIDFQECSYHSVHTRGFQPAYSGCACLWCVMLTVLRWNCTLKGEWVSMLLCLVFVLSKWRNALTNCARVHLLKEENFSVWAEKQNQTFSLFQDLNLDILFSCRLSVFLLSHFFGSFFLFTSSSWGPNLRLQYHSKNVRLHTLKALFTLRPTEANRISQRVWSVRLLAGSENTPDVLSDV